ncbi:MAG: galactose oxidase-like domain-containing protein, partial [Leucothrix sp.]
MKNQNKLLAVFSLAPLMISTGVYAAYSDTGRWSGVINLDLVPVAVANLPDGKVLAWSAKDKLGFGGSTGRTWTTVFDPQNETYSSTLVTETQHDMFCPGISNLADGRIMATGGSGNNKASIYNPDSGTWTAAATMNTPRGYQGQVTMNDGTAFTVGGSWSGGLGNKNAEAWTPEAGWVPFPLITADATVRDGSESEPRGVYRDDNHAWLWAAPNGKVFHAGPSNKMHWIDVQGLGGVTSAGTRGSDPYSMNGTTVMYDRGRILKVGGAQAYDTLDGSGRVQSIDIRTDNAVVTERASLTFPRTLHHSVVLPTGEVFVVGGMKTTKLFKDDDARLTPELWNPSSNTWTSMEPMVTPRTYHSTAILMNDARVFVGGGGLCNTCSTNHPDVELFSPPYLYVDGTNTLATRPVINTAPSTANYAVNVAVQTNAAITRFALVRSSSSTHSVNNEQRRISLAFTGTNNNYQVTMPSRNNAPPGNYMLFAINAAGTPSVAKVIRLGAEDVAPELADGDYWLASPSSGQHLTAPSWNDFKSRMLDANIYTDQQWRVRYQGGRAYTIQNIGTGRYMAVENSSCSNLALISGSTSADANNERWVISKVGENYQFRPLNCITKGLDREQGLNDANGIIFNFIPNHAPQLWNLKPIASNAPVANPDAVTVAQNTAITIDPLINDSGDGLTLLAPNAWSLEGGTVALVVNNKLVYTSKAGFTGLDKIWYTIENPQGQSTFSVIDITVTSNDAYPTASPDNVTVAPATNITIDALANDSGVGLILNAPNVWSLQGGTVALSNNKIIYRSKTGFTGS